jgi:hypothetical protein
MNRLPKSFLVLLLFACTESINPQSVAHKTLTKPKLTVINANFPLILLKVKLNDRTRIVHLSNDVKNKIHQTVYDYYFNECQGDSSEIYFKVRDTYIGTIQLRYSSHSVFVVLLCHVPTNKVNSRILFYNNSTKTFIGKPLDFNLYALSDYSQGKLTPTNLKKQLKINTPEIVLNKSEKNGENEFIFTRLYHNGTSNAIETVVINVGNSTVDTISFKQKWMY